MPITVKPLLSTMIGPKEGQSQKSARSKAVPNRSQVRIQEVV
jgi:hypothetical protein